MTCATLEQALSINDDLLEYASAKAKMVVLDKSVKSSQDTVAGVASVSDLGE